MGRPKCHHSARELCKRGSADIHGGGWKQLRKDFTKKEAMGDKGVMRGKQDTLATSASEGRYKKMNSVRW